ncbi:MAG: GHKL domain-containing protein [Acholeplasmataceae bacterium]|nr:GHKL domain-containing protein [Acholeplasmataceae bacterium]
MNYLFDLSETPGGVYALAYWLGAILFISVRSKKLSTVPLVLVSILFLILLVGGMELNHPVSKVWFIPSIMLYVFVIAVFIYVSVDMTITNVLYYTARAFLIGEFIGSLSWQLYYFSILNDYFPNQFWISILFLVVLESLIFLMIWWIEYRFIRDSKNYSINQKELTTTILIVAVIFLFSNISYLSDNTPFSGQASAEIFNIRTLVDFGGVVLLFASHMQITELNIKFEMDKLQNLLKLQVENYEMSKKSIEMVNRKYHDLKHYITVMKTNAHEGDSIDYLNELENEIKVYEAQNKTGNKVLDTILSAKSITCQINNIRLNVIADGNLLSSLDPIDISTMFGNLLDNSIESVKAIADFDKKLIYLSVTKQKGFLIIHLQNSYVGNITYKNGLPETTKKDSMNHGYGLKSVLNTAKKYDGSLLISNNKNWFEARVLIPIQN